MTTNNNDIVLKLKDPAKFAKFMGLILEKDITPEQVEEFDKVRIGRKENIKKLVDRE